MEIKDTNNKLLMFPKFISKFFVKNFSMQGFIYLDEEEPTLCSDIVRWLDKLEIETTSQEKADKLAFEFYHEKYPQYGNYVQLL